MTHSRGADGRLVVCPTPIGNVQDVTLRVLDALASADVIACEDTRRTGRLLKRLDLRGALVSLHEHNERERSRELVARIRAGEAVALVSDAGTPVLADPGFVLVRDCARAGLAVEVLPGPSAITTALVASALPADRWCFVGFLPRASEARKELFSGARHTLVAFETARRLAGTLALLAELDAERPAAVCRELTKLHEEVRRGSAAELAERFRPGSSGSAATLRGEVVLVVGAGDVQPVRHEQALGALVALLEAGARARPAAAVVARLTGARANELYRDAARLRGAVASGARR
jgi:16S rRNA (cytidine1402-2'-O)-methyltransferase